MRLLPHGTKIGNATVIVDIVDGPNREIRPRTPMKAKALTDHDTGNSGRGADAIMHNRYIHNLGDRLPRDTSHISWHITVDENYIIQHIPFDECCYHCGDGWGVNSGNRTSVGVEKCMHAGADREKIEANAIALHAYLMKELKISIAHVKPHQAWSGKYCPQLILNKYGSFRPFRDKIEKAYKSGVNPVPVKRDYFINGDTGAAVKVIQEHLNKSGVRPPLEIDGIYGNATEAAVRAFQKSNNLLVDGIWGKASQGKMDAILEKLNKPSTEKPKPAKPANKEDEDMHETAVVVNTTADLGTAALLAQELGCGIFFRRDAEKKQVAKTIYIAGGKQGKLKGDKFIDLSGKTRQETAKNIASKF